jgi:hypothetical protein
MQVSKKEKKAKRQNSNKRNEISFYSMLCLGNQAINYHLLKNVFIFFYWFFCWLLYILFTICGKSFHRGKISPLSLISFYLNTHILLLISHISFYSITHIVFLISLTDKLMNLRTYHMEFDPNNVRTSCT